MTDQTKLLQEILGLLSEADQNRLEEVRAVLLRADQVGPHPRLLGLVDLAEFMQRRFGMLDEQAVTELWMHLLEVDDPLIEIYDENGVQVIGDGLKLVNAATARSWRLSRDTIVACARSLTPYGDDMSLRQKMPPLMSTQKTLLLAWAATFTSD